MRRTTSDNGIEMIKRFEGCRLTAYKDPVGIWTIGYGHTHGVTEGKTITQEEADRLLRSDLDAFEGHVNRYDHLYDWTQNEFDALVSFSYNIGGIYQLTKDGTRSKEEIAEKIPAYCNAMVGGKLQPLEGLIRRREEERKLFTSGEYAEKDDSVDGTYYVIQPGDTLTYIAKKFHTTIKKIQKFNPDVIKDIDLIYAGDEIRVR